MTLSSVLIRHWINPQTGVYAVYLRKQLHYRVEKLALENHGAKAMIQTHIQSLIIYSFGYKRASCSPFFDFFSCQPFKHLSIRDTSEASKSIKDIQNTNSTTQESSPIADTPNPHHWDPCSLCVPGQSSLESVSYSYPTPKISRAQILRPTTRSNTGPFTKIVMASISEIPRQIWMNRALSSTSGTGQWKREEEGQEVPASRACHLWQSMPT